MNCYALRSLNPEIIETILECKKQNREEYTYVNMFHPSTDLQTRFKGIQKNETKTFFLF